MTWHNLGKIVFLGVDPAQPPHLFILFKREGGNGGGWEERGNGACGGVGVKDEGWMSMGMERAGVVLG